VAATAGRSMESRIFSTPSSLEIAVAATRGAFIFHSTHIFDLLHFV
jgi:hypothetical protein